MKKIICVLLSVFVLISVMPVTVFADSPTLKSVSSAEELTAACAEINSNGGDYIISLGADITNGDINITNSNAVVTVKGNGYTIDRPNGYTAVNVSGGATVNLGDGESELTITSGSDGEQGIVYVMEGSTCNMYNNVTLKDHEGNNNFGGGVTIQSGIFHMYGGTIQNCGINGGSVCYGGGVAVYSGGEFIMDGGTITGCYATSDYIDDTYSNRYTAIGGGVFITGGSTFIMNSGTISNCTATNMGGGIAVDISFGEVTECGYGNIQSRAEINGGTITNNSADYGAGVFASGYYYSYAGAIAAVTPGPGTTDNPGLYMTGGTITENNSAKDGGGVYVSEIRQGSNIPLSNLTISNNTASSGAGIMINEGLTKAEISGCTVSGNTSTSYGGGIALTNNLNGDTALINSSVTENKTTNNNDKRGAGVYYDKDSKLEISGANTIQNNKYNNKLNNLNILSEEKPVYVTGDLTGSKIGVSDPTLWDDGKEDTDEEAVSTLRLTDGFKANNASLIPANAFTSDHESWVVDFGEEKTLYNYTAKHYKANSWTPTSKSTSNEIIAVDAITFDEKATNTTMLYNEITAQYERDYQKIDEDFYYDSVTDSYIQVAISGYNVYVYVLDTNYDYKKLLFLGASYQAYVSDGQLAIILYKSYSDIDDVTYSDSYEEKTATYSEPLGSDEEEEVYNNIGYISEKVIISKNSETETKDSTYTNEVRLVRAEVNYYINNGDMASEYTDDVFTPYVEDTGEEVKIGNTIKEFYKIPELKDNSAYIFKGWYYDEDNSNDTRPVKFGTDVYSKNIYAHWIKINDVEKDEEDTNVLPPGDNNKYGGFDLSGIQIKDSIYDTNFGEHKKPGGMRFLTSLSMDIVNEINNIKPNNIEYGYIASTNEAWIKYHISGNRKLLYNSTNTNGVNTKNPENDEDYFGFVKNINCTSKVSSTNGVVNLDHRNYNDYLLYTLVITYENSEESDYSKNVIARPYIKYTDANGLERVAYSEYRGTNVLGGCYTNYNAVSQ